MTKKSTLTNALDAVRRLSLGEPSQVYEQQDFRLKDDRSLAILMAANVESALYIALQRALRLRGVIDAGVLSESGALAKHSSKLVTAQVAGIFGPITRNNLRIISVVRNAFAHSRREISFADDKIVRLASFLEASEHLLDESQQETALAINASDHPSRKIFIECCLAIERGLLAYALNGSSATSNPASRLVKGPKTLLSMP